MVPAVSIVGHKNSGKTTLAERLIARFTRDGLTVAAVKHTSDERGFDKSDSDSDRLMSVGATAVALVTRTAVGFYATRATGGDPAWLEATLATMATPIDLIVYEGFRGGHHPKIECVLDRRVDVPSSTAAGGLIAVVANHALTADVPVIAYEDLDALVRVIRETFHPCAWPATVE